MHRMTAIVALALTACFGRPAAGEPVEDIDTLSQSAVDNTPRITVVEAPVEELQPQASQVPLGAEEAPVELEHFGDYQLRRGETLAHFARWSQLPVEVIAEASGLDLSGDYQVGTSVRVPLDPEGLALLQQQREEHRQRRLEGWLASRGGSAGTTFYQVGTGDNAWTIARQHHRIPVWVVEAYNPSLDLDRLRPGQEIMLPTLGEGVAEAP